MYPLLVTAATHLAGNLIDRLTAPKAEPAAQSAVPFSSVLQGAQNGAPAAGLNRSQMMAALRQRLLNSPELQALAAADPSKMAAVTITPQGAVQVPGSDGRSVNLALSPGTAAIARELGSSLPAPANLAQFGLAAPGATVLPGTRAISASNLLGRVGNYSGNGALA
jgi:hypothetical protein